MSSSAARRRQTIHEITPVPHRFVRGGGFFMERCREARAALAVTAAAVGVDFAAGRELAAFYAQMAGASWLGVAFSALLFGLITAMIAHMAQKSGAGNIFAMFRRTAGGAVGWISCALYAAILLTAGWMLISAAANLGALALPLHRAPLFGAAFALLAAAWIALRGAGSMRRVGAVFVGMFAAYELALLLFARIDSLPGMLFVLELRLGGSWAAAIMLALVHAAMCACLSAGVTVRMAGDARPARLGLWAGGIFFALLLIGNAALRNQMNELLALEVPFVALASCWGSAGFWISASVMYLAAVTSLSALFSALMPGKWMLNSKYFRE